VESVSLDAASSRIFPVLILLGGNRARPGRKSRLLRPRAGIVPILFDPGQFRFRLGDLVQAFTREFGTDAFGKRKAIKSDKAAKFFNAPVHGGYRG
jgi:hypothetical protein